MTTALVFPGQGSQAIGMGQALAANFAEAREVLQEVDDALGFALSTLMKEGPEADLTATQNAQPAIMAASLAAFRVMQKQMGFALPAGAACVAGHSLGEYSALTAAGALGVAQAARLLRTRGDAMQAAVPQGQGGMVAVIGPELAAVEAIVAEARTKAPGEVIEIANHNSTNQIVLSGSVKGMEMAIEVAKAMGAKRALPLAVSAPFHCSLMAPAATVMQHALAESGLRAPQVPLVANVTAAYVSDAATIQSLLVKQVTGMVRWVDSIHAMQAQGVTRIIEIGHGQVLSGLIKRIAPEMACVNIGTPEDLDAFAAKAA
ncbi:MAG: ACP S-malonyltransferase [Pseudomonadota bacterium]